MTTVQTSIVSGTDGLLTVVVPVAEANREYRVVVSVEPAESSAPTTSVDEETLPRLENGILVTAHGWPKGYFHLVGCMADDPIHREAQDQFQPRESLD
jgi:hypothetical protein